MLARVLAVAAALTVAAPAPAGDAQTDPLSRARIAYAALQKHFGSPNGLYREQADARSPWARAWPYSQALAAIVAVNRIPDGGGGARPDLVSSVQASQRYWDATARPPAFSTHVGPAGHHWYDDNEWLGLDLVDAYRLTGDRSSLARAQQVFDRVVSGWDPDGSRRCAGGVRWTDRPANGDRNTVSNAPGAQLGLELHALTGNRSDLVWARRMYHWVLHCLRSPSELYWDHIGADGAVDRTVWSYNQGSMAAAGVLLWQATGNRGYLVRSRRIGRAAVRWFTPARLRSEPAEFAAILFTDLLSVDAVDSDPRYRAAMQRYGDWAWHSARDPRTGLFRFPGRDGLISQGAMVRIYAALATPAP